MDNKLSREISEKSGVKQGHIKSSDNYKIYANPLLDTLESANLGVQLGPVTCGFSSQEILRTRDLCGLSVSGGYILVQILKIIMSPCGFEN